MKELHNLKEHVYDEIQNNGQNTISIRWVLSRKTCNGEEIVNKEWLVHSHEVNAAGLFCHDFALSQVLTYC